MVRGSKHGAVARAPVGFTTRFDAIILLRGVGPQNRFFFFFLFLPVGFDLQWQPFHLIVALKHARTGQLSILVWRGPNTTFDVSTSVLACLKWESRCPFWWHYLLYTRHIASSSNTNMHTHTYIHICCIDHLYEVILGHCVRSTIIWWPPFVGDNLSIAIIHPFYSE